MIKLNTLKPPKQTYFPVLISDSFLETYEYERIVSNFDKYFEKFNQSPSGQKNRSNIIINHENLIEFKEYPEISKLFESIENAKQSIFDLLYSQNTNLYKNILSENIINNVKLEIHLSLSRTGYENPYHVDTRHRLIHGLI